MLTILQIWRCTVTVKWFKSSYTLNIKGKKYADLHCQSNAWFWTMSCWWSVILMLELKNSDAEKLSSVGYFTAGVCYKGAAECITAALYCYVPADLPHQILLHFRALPESLQTLTEWDAELVLNGRYCFSKWQTCMYHSDLQRWGFHMPFLTTCIPKVCT